MRELAVIKGDEVKAILPVSDDVYLNYRLHRDVLSDFSRDYQLLRLVSDCYDDFIEGLISVAQAIVGEAHALNQNHLHDFSFKANKLILAFLGAVKTFQDHGATTISRRYGSESSELELFKALMSEKFDSEFSYRFFCKLRNYTQHCGMPPLGFSVSHDFPGSIEILFSLDRQVLLKEYDGWGAIVKRDLQSSNELIYVLPELEKYMKSVMDIYLSFYKESDFEKVGRSREWLCDFISDSDPGDHYGFLEAKIREDADGQGLSLRIEWIPTAMIREVAFVEKLVSS